MMYQAYRAATSALELFPGPWQPEPRPAGVVDGVIHGASAGEVKAARALLTALQLRRPGEHWAVSSGTPAGVRSGADFRLPRDLPSPTASFFADLQLRSLLLVEAELWPNLIAAAARRRVPVAVVSARVSARTEARMGRLGREARRMLELISAFAAASERDAMRLQALGVAPDRIEVGGWLKWPSPLEPAEAGIVLQEEARFDRPRPLFVLGSIHPGEARVLARRLAGSELEPGRANWLLVARHARSGSQLRREAAALCPSGSYSIDSRMGVLRSWYQRAAASFVGGGLKGRGCHDLLEPLSAGLRPMCFLRSGDPGGVGAVLTPRGLVVNLDGQQAAAAVARIAMERAPGAYAQLQQEFDGRSRTLDFLEAKGVLPT